MLPDHRRPKMDRTQAQFRLVFGTMVAQLSKYRKNNQGQIYDEQITDFVAYFLKEPLKANRIRTTRHIAGVLLGL